MKNNIENGIYIPDEHRNLIPVDEWVKLFTCSSFRIVEVPLE